MMKRLPPFLIAILIGPLAAQCPSNSSAHFMCTASGGNTDITLFQNADLNWDGFNLAAGNTMNITSSGGTFASTHIVSGPAQVFGDIIADGPFTMLSNHILTVDGLITAPSITLSNLPLSSDESVYEGNQRARNLLIRGNLTAKNGDVAVLSHRQTNFGIIEANSGKVILASADTATIS